MGYIYQITNIENNKKYIGCCSDPERRWLIHRNSLLEGNHHNLILQNSFNKRGRNLENYKFEIIEVCQNDTLLDREAFYIDSLKTIYPNGYNLCKYGKLQTGIKRSEKTLWVKSEQMKRAWQTSERLKNKKWDRKESSKKQRETLRRRYLAGEIIPWNKGKKGKQIAWNKGKSYKMGPRPKMKLAWQNSIRLKNRKIDYMNKDRRKKQSNLAKKINKTRERNKFGRFI